MIKDIERIGASVIVGSKDIYHMSEEVMAEHIISQLASELAQFIVGNVEDLPVHCETEQTSNMGKEYTIRLNLISDKELQRLKEIEKAYKRCGTP